MTLHVWKDINNTPVDWWFMYKLPQHIEPHAGAADTYQRTTGWEYLYMDSSTGSQLQLSANTLDQKQGSLHQTLAQLYDADASSAESLGWICYNDEIPGQKSNNSSFGHTKGVLAFDLDSDSAFWLLHSWPKFPDIPSGRLGSPDYAQTFLCISLDSVETARYIAEQMYHRQEPQTYETRIPQSLSKDDIFYKLAHDVDVNETDPPCDITFFSKGQNAFRLIAKNRHWDKDFWIDLVGPHLQTDMDVETWRRGTVPGTEDSNRVDTVTDVLYINLERLGIPYEWYYTKDHAKWGVSKSQGWVCIGDINRQTSQEKRGGGAICFQSDGLWKALGSVEQLKA